MSIAGDSLSNVGDLLSTVRGVRYHGGGHEYRREYLEYRGGIMMHVRDIMSALGCSVLWGGGGGIRQFLVICVPPRY